MSQEKDRRECWRRMIRQWEASGLSKAEFSRSRGIPPWKFYSWESRLRKEGVDRSGGFAQVEIPTETGISFRLPNGLEIHLQPGFDEESLKRVLKAAGSLC